METTSEASEAKIKRMRHWMRSAIVLFVVLSIVGFCFQIYLVSSLFISFEITTETSTEFPPELKPPSLSFCFFITDIKRPGLFPHDQPCRPWTGRDRRVQYKEPCNFRISANEILNRTLDFEDLVTHITVKDPKNSTFVIYKNPNFDLSPEMEKERASNSSSKKYQKLVQDLGDFTGQGPDANLQVYFKNFRKCFTFNLLDNHEWLSRYPTVDYYDLNELQYISSDPIFEIGFTKYPEILNEIVNVHVYIHPKGRLPRGNIWFPVIIEPYYSVLATYTRYNNMYLRKPFETDCFNYSEWSLESREHCVTDCVITAYRKDKGDNLPLNIVFESQYFKKVMQGLAGQDYFRRCGKDCQQLDCDYELIVPKVNSKVNISGNFSGIIFQLEIKEPETRAKFDPKLEPINFIIYIASAIGLWFGYSVFNVMCSVITYVQQKVRMYKYYKAKKEFEKQVQRSEGAEKGTSP